MTVYKDFDIAYPLSLDNDLLVAERTPVFSLMSTYGLSAFRDVEDTTDATISHGGVGSSSEFELTTDAAGTGEGTLTTKNIGRYQPGVGAEGGIGIRSGESSMTGNQVQSFGLGDGTNGLYFKWNASDLYVVRQDNGVETTYAQSTEWNLDRLDGTESSQNPSGLELDLAKGNIFIIRYGFYGHSPILWGVKIWDQTALKQKIVWVHIEKPDNKTSIRNPNLPLFAKVENGGTATSHSLYVSGRQYSILGKERTEKRNSIQYVNNISTATGGLVPYLSFRYKTNYKSIASHLKHLDIITDQNLHLQIRQNTTLGGTSPSWGNLNDTTAKETAFEVDTSATTISGGEKLWEGLVEGGGPGGSVGGEDTGLGDIYFANDDIITICGEAISTGGTAHLVAIMEELR